MECSDVTGFAYDSVEDCEAFIGAFAAAAQELSESYDDCTYNADNAAACLDEMALGDCDTLLGASVCTDVYEGTCE